MTNAATSARMEEAWLGEIMASSKNENGANGAQKDIDSTTKTGPLTCGLIMPISAADGCTAEHWSDVKAIIIEAIEAISDLSFSVRLVSDADDVGVIQKRIVQNVYSSDVIVCDVSGKNPNVMFELGMRLAFDKPTVIIKDDKTDYSFDTGIIEHVPYPRDLRFSRMVTFKTLLADKIVGTYNTAKSNPDHSTFLKNFGKFHVASLNEDIVPADKIVVEMLLDIQGEMARLRRTMPHEFEKSRGEDSTDGTIRVVAEIMRFVEAHPKANLSKLITSSKFRNEMEQKCDAPKYFNSPSEFSLTLERVARIVSMTNSLAHSPE